MTIDKDLQWPILLDHIITFWEQERNPDMHCYNIDDIFWTIVYNKMAAPTVRSTSASHNFALYFDSTSLAKMVLKCMFVCWQQG